jgi:hypothetical protein
LIEILRLGNDCLDFEFDLAKIGWEGCRDKGGVDSGFLPLCLLLTRPDQSPEDDRNIFLTDVRFF